MTYNHVWPELLLTVKRKQEDEAMYELEDLRCHERDSADTRELSSVCSYFSAVN